MGRSNHMLMVHHHNILYSSHGGKDLSRFIMPNGGDVGGPAYTRLHGSRTEPAGPVFCAMTMGLPPWDAVDDKVIKLPGRQPGCQVIDLGHRKMTTFQ